jgi:hypothetical protein
VKRVTYTAGDGVLIPNGSEAREQFDKLANGEEVAVVITRPRDRKANARVHFAIERLAAAMGVSVLACRGWLLVKAGFADVVRWPPGVGGQVTVVPHSITEMSPLEFEMFWDDASGFIVTEVLPLLPPVEAVEIGRLLHSREN